MPHPIRVWISEAEESATFAAYTGGDHSLIGHLGRSLLYERPYFLRDEAERVARFWQWAAVARREKYGPHVETDVPVYCADRDCYVSSLTGQRWPTMQIGGDEAVRVYGIGVGDWSWTEFQVSLDFPVNSGSL